MDHVRDAILNSSIKLNAGRGAYIFDNRELFLSSEHRLALYDAAIKLWDRITYLNPDVLVTKGYGGLPLVLAMAGFSHADVLIVRDARKKEGLRRLVEGPPPDKLPPRARAVFVDDLFNAGNTFRKAQIATDIEGYDLEYVGAAVLVDFWHNSRVQWLLGMPVESLYRRHELGITRKDATASLSLRVAWHVPHLNDDIGLECKSWPRIKDRRLYVGSDDGHFHCFDTDAGGKLWSHYSERPQRKGNVCVPDFHGTNVIISSYDGTVRALNQAHGGQAWCTKADLNLHSSPLVVEDRIFIGTEYDKHGGSTWREWNGRGDIICLDAFTGEEVWRTKTDGMIPCTPAYDLDFNMIACGSNDFHLYLLDADSGAIMNKIATRGEVKGKPIIDREHIYTLSTKGWLQCFACPDGDLLWERDLGGSKHAWPIFHNNRLYVTNHNGMSLCLDRHGHVKWMVRLRDYVGWGFSWIGHRLAALTMSGQLVTIDPSTGVRLTSDDLSKLPGMRGVRAFQPVTRSGSRLYVATNNRGLLALDYDLSD